MLESKAQAILGAQSTSMGLDTDVSESTDTKSKRNSVFSAEFTRAQESIASEKNSGGTQESSSDEINQSAEAPLVNSVHSPVSKNNNPLGDDAVESHSYKSQLLGSSKQSLSDGNTALNSAQDSLLRSDLNSSGHVRSASEVDLVSHAASTNHVHEKQASHNRTIILGNNSEISDETEVMAGTSQGSLLQTQNDALQKVVAGEQFDKELTAIKYGNSAPAENEKRHDNPLANLGKSNVATVHTQSIANPSDRVVSINRSEESIPAETNQEAQAALGKTKLVAGLEEDIRASDYGSVNSAVSDVLVTTDNNVESKAAKDIGSNGERNLTAAVTLGAGAESKNDGANRTATTSLSNTDSTFVPAVERQQVTVAAVAQGMPLNTASITNTGVSSSVDANTNPQSIVAGHNLLHSVSNAQVDSQLRNVNTTEMGVGVKPLSNQSTQNPQNPISPTGLVDITKPSATVDVSASVMKVQTAVGERDSGDPLTMNVVSIGGRFNADSFSATNGDSSSGQHTSQHAAPKLGFNADKDISSASMLNAAQNQIKAADVTPENQIKQMLGAKQQPELTGLQALNASIDTPSSNVYHVTTNGIIPANSTSLNAAPLSDLASAPRTVLLGEPDADQSLVENLRWAVNEKMSRVTVNVSPANLGPISVSVDVENQNMSVSIITNNVVAKEAIDGLLPRMREHFSNEGYNQVSVDVSSQQERNSNLRNQTAEFFNNQKNAESDSRGDETQITPSSQHDITPEQSLLLSKHQPGGHSLIDTYA